MSSYLTFHYFDLLQYRQPCQPAPHDLADRTETQHPHISLMHYYFATIYNVTTVLYAPLIIRNIDNPLYGVKTIMMFEGKKERRLTFVGDFIPLLNLLLSYFILP